MGEKMNIAICDDSTEYLDRIEKHEIKRSKV